MRISLSVTPGVFCACVGAETVKRQPMTTLSPKRYFGVSFFIFLSVLKRGPWRWNFYMSCLVSCQGDVNALAVTQCVAVSSGAMAGIQRGITLSLATTLYAAQ